MMNIRVQRYGKPALIDGTPNAATYWQGSIEPEDRSWIAFIDRKGRPLFFLNRDPATGAIMPDDPVEHEAFLRDLAVTGGLRTGMRAPDGDEAGRIAGQPVEPLGSSGADD